jgi:hypothetical protein
MLAITEPQQDDPQTWPTTGVRVGINTHPQTIGGHRVRFSFSPAVAAILRRGLTFPRVHVDGTMMSGFRVWCVQDGTSGGLAPIASNSGAWSFTMPGHKLRCRRELVGSSEVEFTWSLGERGPVLLIPRLPDRMIPKDALTKLPNSQVDPETVRERAEVRLQRELAKLTDDAPEAPEPEPHPVLALPPPPEPEPEREPVVPGSFTISGTITNPDLLAAVVEVRELLKMLREHADVTAKINMPPELEL